VKFPVTIRHRASKAKIYAPAGKFAYYRVAYTTAGKRKMQTFAAYSDAKTAAERIVRELANGSQASSLTASQSRDALAALERLATLQKPPPRHGENVPQMVRPAGLSACESSPVGSGLSDMRSCGRG
jgi:hypothetical protein